MRRETLPWKVLAVFIGIAGLLVLSLSLFPQTLRAEEKTNNTVEVTVYNENLALVKDQRQMEIPAGIGRVTFNDVAAMIDPTSVMFRSLGNPGLRVLEQNYEYDVVGSAKLLQKFIGQKITLTTAKGETLQGYLMGTEGGIILASQPNGGEVRVVTGNLQSITFPELPSGLVTRPTLVWLLSNPSKADQQPVEVSYLTGGLSWKADYVATVNANDDRVDLTGWVTLNNQSGVEYKDARLKLVAGDVNRVPDEEPTRARDYLMATKQEAANDGFKEESFFEYHLYKLGRPTTLQNNQTKQVELLSAASVAANKRFIYEGAYQPKKVKVMLEFDNMEKNNLGMPLPKGRIRVQKADSDGSLQFVGEDRIDHTPKDEKVRIYLGNAFDIVGERIQTNVTKVSENSREESFKITLRNHKKEAVTVTAIESMMGWTEWKIVKSDQKYVKTESGKAEFTVAIPAGGEVTINYTVRYKW